MSLRQKVHGSSKLHVKDLGLGRILEELNKADNSFTKVGYPAEGEAKEGTRKGSGREQYDTISEVAEIAFYNEFGTGTTPERSFIRTSFDENLEKINQMKIKLYNMIVDGKMTVHRALGIMGEAHVNHIKRKIRDIHEPPNAPSTIARKKGADNPLIDTAQMLNSVQHVEIINNV